MCLMFRHWLSFGFKFAINFDYYRVVSADVQEAHSYASPTGLPDFYLFSVITSIRKFRVVSANVQVASMSAHIHWPPRPGTGPGRARADWTPSFFIFIRWLRQFDNFELYLRMLRVRTFIGHPTGLPVFSSLFATATNHCGNSDYDDFFQRQEERQEDQRIMI
jgi:hypothetical protein